MFQADGSFKTRGGFEVIFAESGGIEVRGPGGVRDYTPPSTTFAIEEAMQARHDRDLGRWRWPENPDIVVWAHDSDVFVLDERRKEYCYFPNFEPEEVALMMPREDEMQRMPYLTLAGIAAECFFFAQPRRKPWEDAQPGDIWLVTRGRESEVCRVVKIGDDVRFQIIVPSGPLRSYGLDHETVTAAERIGQVSA